MKKLIVALAFFLSSVAFLIIRTEDWRPFNRVESAMPKQSQAGLMPFGSLFPPIVLDREGESIDSESVLSGHWTLIICSSSTDEPQLDYPLLLLRRYRDRGLMLALVLSSPRARAEAEVFARSSGSNSALQFLTDSHGELSALFADHGYRGFDAVILIDPDRKVRFSVPDQLQRDTLRQVIERNLLGHVAYRIEAQAAGLPPGARLPDFLVRRIQDGKTGSLLSDLGPGRSTVVFFQGNCAGCVLRPLLRDLQRMQNRDDRLQGQRIWLVFSRVHSQQDLDGLIRGLPLMPSIYRAEDYVLELEDPYNSIADQRQPATALIVEDGIVIESLPLKEWITGHFNSVENGGS